MGQPDAGRCLEWCLVVSMKNVRGQQKQQDTLLLANDAGYKRRGLGWMPPLCFALCSPAYISQPWCNVAEEKRVTVDCCRIPLWTWTLCDSDLTLTACQENLFWFFQRKGAKCDHSGLKVCFCSLASYLSCEASQSCLWSYKYEIKIQMWQLQCICSLHELTPTSSTVGKGEIISI